jgi:hypothetical protein
MYHEAFLPPEPRNRTFQYLRSHILFILMVNFQVCPMFSFDLLLVLMIKAEYRIHTFTRNHVKGRHFCLRFEVIMAVRCSCGY